MGYYCSILFYVCFIPSVASFRGMTILSNSSPSCARSLEAQLQATSFKMSNERQPSKGVETSSPMASPHATPQENGNCFPIPVIRNLIFRLSAITGSLSSLFLNSAVVPLDSNNAERQQHSAAVAAEEFVANGAIAAAMAHLLATLMDLSCSLSVNLHTACCKKIELNGRKYPVDLCKGKAGKYTEYSQKTGITKTIGQSTVETLEHDSVVTNDEDDSALQWRNTFVEQSVPALTSRTRQFAIDRDWLRYHTPRNLLLALTGELGELAEIFQFKGDDEDQSLSMAEQDKVGQEIADVTIYLIRLADVCGLSLMDEMKRLEQSDIDNRN